MIITRIGNTASEVDTWALGKFEPYVNQNEQRRFSFWLSSESSAL